MKRLRWTGGIAIVPRVAVVIWSGGGGGADPRAAPSGAEPIPVDLDEARALLDRAGVDPGGYLRSDWVCDGGYNIARYCDPQTDQMIDDAVAIEDPDARSDAYAEIAEKLQSEAASVFLLHEHAIWGTQPDVSNFQPHPQEYYVLTAELALGGN